MEPVSPDIAKKLLSRDFANLVGRVQKGGKLTRAERAMLQSMAGEGGCGIAKGFLAEKLDRALLRTLRTAMKMFGKSCQEWFFSSHV